MCTYCSSVLQVSDGRAVDVETASFSWERHAPRPTLRGLQLAVQPGQLVAVVGQVGAGKSSLLSALLGEMEKLHGFAGTQGRVAFVPQQSWIQNQSVRENILFGQPFDQEFYDAVVDVSTVLVVICLPRVRRGPSQKVKGL